MTPIRHFTASAFVIDERKRVLLLWHRKMQRWMPPGGHVDPNELPQDAAVRECKEETGLDISLRHDHQPDFFTSHPEEGRMLISPTMMFLEEIPANGQHPAHQHMDFVFVAHPLDPLQPLAIDTHEAADLRWFTLDEVLALEPEEVFGNVRAFIRQFLA